MQSEEHDGDSFSDPQKVLQLCKRLVLPKTGHDPDKEIGHCIEMCNEFKRNMNPPYRGVVADLNVLKKEEQYLSRFGCELLGATELLMSQHRAMIKEALAKKLPLPQPSTLPPEEYKERLKSSLAIYASAFCYEIDVQENRLNELKKAATIAAFERKLMMALTKKQEDEAMGKESKAIDPKALAKEAYAEIYGL